MVELSHLYMTTGKAIALPIWTFVLKVMSLFFYFVAAIKHSLSILIFESKKINLVTVSIVSPSICHEVIGPDAMIFVFLNAEF